MVLWQWIALGYFAYLAVVAIANRRFRRARWPALAVTCIFLVLCAVQPPSLGPAVQALLPAPVLLVGYWLSGLFFVRPMLGLEQWLLRIDGPLLGWRSCPRVMREYFELSYILVYAIIPAGALTLALGGHADAVARFWAIVLLAEFASYGTLPWVQTRPPRVVEARTIETPSMLRRLNLAVLGRGSIQANTFPSGHAAGSVAVALAVSGPMPTAGLVFVVLAASIVAATVIGRYHYVVDSVLGLLVAVAAWSLLIPG